MNGAVDFFHLTTKVDILDFISLKKKVEKLSREQAKQAK